MLLVYWRNKSIKEKIAIYTNIYITDARWNSRRRKKNEEIERNIQQCLMFFYHFVRSNTLTSAPFNILLTFFFINSISLSWQQNFDNSQAMGFNALKKKTFTMNSKSKCVPWRSFISRKDGRSMIKMIASLRNTPALPITWLTFSLALHRNAYDT